MTLDLDGMMELLSFYLGDTKEQKHPPDLLLVWMNIGQDKAVTLLNRHQISEADIYVSDPVLYGDGSFDLSSLSVATANLANSLDRVRIKDGKFFRKISLQEWAKKKGENHVFTTLEPKFYARGKKIMCEPFSADDVATGSIEEDVVYVNYGYTTVTYDGNPYTDGQSFTGVSGVTTYTTAGSGVVFATQELEIWYTRRATQMALESGDVASGMIAEGTVYVNSGYTKVTYNSIEYADGLAFVGVNGVTTYTTTGSGSVFVANQDYANVDCEFQSVAVREVIVQLAASVGWKTIKGGMSRSYDFYKSAVIEIERLNLLTSGTDSVAQDQEQGEDVQVVGDINYRLAT